MKYLKIMFCFAPLLLFMFAGCEGGKGQPGAVENPPPELSPAGGETGVVDTDGDGVTDDVDACSDTPAGTAVDATGCEAAAAPPAESIFRDISQYVFRRFVFAFPKWTGIKVFERAEIDYYANDMAVNQKTGEVYVVGKKCKEGSCTGLWATFSKRGEMSVEAMDNKEATGIAVDDNGYVYIVGDVNDNAEIIKYSLPSANVKGLEWQVSFNKVGIAHWAKAITIDATGKYIYVVGSTKGRLDDSTAFPHGEIDYDAYVARLDATNGYLLWIRQFRNSGYSSNVASSVVVDASGNIYVTGYHLAALVRMKTFLARLSPESGDVNINWGSDIYEPTGLAFDEAPFVLNYRSDTHSYFVQKYDKDVLTPTNWRILGLGTDEDDIVGDLLTESGNLFAAICNEDMSIISEFAIGETVATPIGRNFLPLSILEQKNCPVGIALDKDGNIYMAGNVKDVKNKIYVAKFNSNLELQ